MFSGVFEVAARPSTQRQPRKNADDMGARLNEPSSLTVLIRTTGVPKYRMPGSMVICMLELLAGGARHSAKARRKSPVRLLLLVIIEDICMQRNNLKYTKDSSLTLNKPHQQADKHTDRDGDQQRRFQDQPDKCDNIRGPCGRCFRHVIAGQNMVKVVALDCTATPGKIRQPDRDRSCSAGPGSRIR